MCIHLDAVSALTRRTDGQIFRNNQQHRTLRAFRAICSLMTGLQDTSEDYHTHRCVVRNVTTL